MIKILLHITWCTSHINTTFVFSSNILEYEEVGGVGGGVLGGWGGRSNKTSDAERW